jgi:hydroxymethylglutaryl-CoA reductase
MNECEVPGSNNIDGIVELIRNVPIAMSEPSVVASALI